jgi:hypothetical protein
VLILSALIPPAGLVWGVFGFEMGAVAEPGLGA